MRVRTRLAVLAGLTVLAVLPAAAGAAPDPRDGLVSSGSPPVGPFSQVKQNEPGVAVNPPTTIVPDPVRVSGPFSVTAPVPTLTAPTPMGGKPLPLKAIASSTTAGAASGALKSIWPPSATVVPLPGPAAPKEVAPADTRPPLTVVGPV